MLARVFSAAVWGVDAHPVEVEVNCGHGETAMVVVGLPDTAVKESRDRVKTAVENSGYRRPIGRTTVNLAPADIKKEGPAFDLPMAVGLLAASGQMEADGLEGTWMTGELALAGDVRPVKGVLAVALAAAALGARRLLVPAENAREAGVVQGLEIIPVASLRAAVEFVAGTRDIAPVTTDPRSLLEHDADSP
ncbi:MAG: magnesium chelatase domain-containing protein, partial [Verrucomicrobiota bacterium]